MDLALPPIRVLFVDDEQAVLDGIRNVLRKDRRRWDLTFASGAAEALSAIGERGFDIVVTDLSLPKMSGLELLARVREVHPLALRIVLTGSSERPKEAETVAHHFLTKPCEAVVLRGMLERASDLSRRITHPELVAIVERLPTLPSSIHADWPERRKGAEPAEGSADAVAAARFMAMTKAVFSMKASSDTTRVLARLGDDVANAISIAAQIFGAFAALGVTEPELDQLQAHSLMTAWLSPTMLDELDDARTAFIAGLLHDVGRLPLLLTPGAHVDEEEDGDEQSPAGHSELGAHLLARWNLPLAVIEAVAHHHHPPAVAGTFSVPWAVHLADALVHEAAGGKLNVLSGVSTQRTTAAFLANLENRMTIAR
ncbi:MAG TPA: response regulator, partial [Polyangiaceae bacterium]|nr:response regulator [Polyangiaceae bacterium]